MHSAYARPGDRDIDEINPTTGNRRWGKSRFSGSLPTKITSATPACMTNPFSLPVSVDGMKSSSVLARVTASLRSSALAYTQRQTEALAVKS
jgi:hypothetical protein